MGREREARERERERGRERERERYPQALEVGEQADGRRQPLEAVVLQVQHLSRERDDRLRARQGERGTISCEPFDLGTTGDEPFERDT